MTAVAALLVLEISIPFLPGSQAGGFQPESVLVGIAWNFLSIKRGLIVV